MVGVPRSKGCASCRKRKCDQTKPQCQVCRKRGVPCEGYAKYPVVIQWTNKGLKKRERFEEIAPASQSPESNSTTIVSIPSTSLPLRIHSSSPASWSSIEDDFNTIPTRQPHSGGLILAQMEVRCLETYLPDNGAAVSDVKSSWMWQTVDLPARGNALNSACAALSLARMGAVRRDQELVLQGRKQYAMALTYLQNALYDSELAFQDRTLAAMRTLSIYELLSPTFAPVPPGKTHEDGMNQWCRAAGPRSFDSKFALMVFHDVRWSIMIHGIDGSKSSVLGNEEWLTLPWRHFDKDSLEELFDSGFSIAAILEQVSGLDHTTKPELATQLSTLCSAVRQNLDLWYRKHWGTLDCSTILMLGGLFEASNMVYYWWFKIVLNEALITLGRQLSAGAVNPSENASLQQLASTSLRAENTSLATDIVGAAPFFSAEDTGWLGPQRLLFPLKRAMAHLASVKSPVFAEAQMVFMQLIKKMRTC